jgi:hypothetical protein
MHSVHLTYYLIFLLIVNINAQTKKTDFKYDIQFEVSNGEETSTYEDVINFYKSIAEYSDIIEISEVGITDAGLPLHLVSYIPNKDSNNINLLINNGIHPGESDGIDASMLLLKDIVNARFRIPKNVNLYIIPTYNIGGMLNRNSTSRANQNGPKAYGFRGNARNFDLNRDFIKMDTKNMEAFAQIYHSIDPDIYVETHVSNGADYQYTLTHLLTQHNRLGYDLGKYLEKTFRPKLESELNKKNLIITPYVNVFGRTPDKGFSQFMDYPRYSTGYTSLWNTLGLMIETHMLKSYKNRVLQTKVMLETIIEMSSKDAKTIKTTRKTNTKQFLEDDYYKYNYKVDSTNASQLNFKGFEGEISKSKVTGKPRLQYNQNKAFTKPIPYYNNFKATDSVKIPDYYTLKSGWKNILEKLEINNIQYTTLQKDTIIKIEKYSISDFKTYNSPYEGHYPHYNTKVHTFTAELELKAGDYLIPVKQQGIKYLLETLEPMLNDSFFNWNFFDTILQQKEGFSSYVFEDYAYAFLKENPEINAEFLSKKASDSDFAASDRAQLNWIYKKSPLYEEAHLNYPVYRVFN